ncbi:MAG: FtsW/RodA/SpoVE family cell cycle protein, partial [Dehalococcoidia bacterium]
MAARTIRRATSVAATHGPDYALIAVIAVLCVIGLIVSYSASYALGYAQYDDANYFVKRQFTFLLLGTVIAAVLMRLDYHILFRLS